MYWNWQPASAAPIHTVALTNTLGAVTPPANVTPTEVADEEDFDDEEDTHTGPSRSGARRTPTRKR
jgi:hypothetical protein